MSDFMDMFVDMLPLCSALQSEGNELRRVLDRSVGEYMDARGDGVGEMLFVSSASGGWLDAHGRMYGVPRKLDETDEDYRQRIVYEKLDELTPSLLVDVYGVKLFSLVDDFNVYSNSLVSDNPFLGSDGFMGVADDDVISILDKKFILGTGVTWVSDFGELEYILNSLGVNVLSDYSRVYLLSDLNWYFYGNVGIIGVKLVLPNTTNCGYMFRYCSALTDVDLSLPNATNCHDMFHGCSALTSVDLSLPNATICDGMFWGCSDLTSVDLSLPNATNCTGMFRDCSDLTSVDLNLPNNTDCTGMFLECSALTDVKLNMPNLSSYDYMFYNCSNLETIDVTIPTSKVSGFKSYVTGLNLQHLTSFKINGEEQL